METGFSDNNSLPRGSYFKVHPSKYQLLYHARILCIFKKIISQPAAVNSGQHAELKNIKTA